MIQFLVQFFNIIKHFWRSAMFLMFTMFLFSHKFKSSGKPGFPHFDKLVHFGLFCLLAFLVLFDFNRSRNKSVSVNVWIILAGLVMYGALVEVVQGVFMSYRSGSIYDLIFDTLGAFLGAYVFVLYKKSRLA